MKNRMLYLGNVNGNIHTHILYPMICDTQTVKPSLSGRTKFLFIQEKNPIKKHPSPFKNNLSWWSLKGFKLTSIFHLYLPRFLRAVCCTFRVFSVLCAVPSAFSLCCVLYLPRFLCAVCCTFRVFSVLCAVPSAFSPCCVLYLCNTCSLKIAPDLPSLHAYLLLMVHFFNILLQAPLFWNEVNYF